MKLNVQERLILSRIVPEKGNFETMATVEKLREALFLSEEEVEEFELKQTDTAITWNEKGSEPKDIDLSIKGKALLVKTLEELDEKEELSAQHYVIFKRFKEEEGAE
jgi:hypothetical protein